MLKPSLKSDNILAIQKVSTLANIKENIWIIYHATAKFSVLSIQRLAILLTIESVVLMTWC